MTTDTNAGTSAGTTTVVVPTAETPKAEVKKVEIVKLDLTEGAKAIVAASPSLVLKPTESNTYKILTTAVDGDTNFKKGVFFNVNSSATGFNIELQLYSTKGGAHLVQFVERFDEFNGVEIDGQKIEKQKMGLAARLRIKLPYSLGIEGCAALAAKFIALVTPVAEAIRAEVKVDAKPVKTKKPAKVVAEKTAEGAPAGKKVQSKAKTKKPVAKATVEVPPLNPEIDAALADIAK